MESDCLSQAARICGVSHRTIERLVEASLLKCEQVTPRAPWEIRRTDLDAEPIRGIIDRLHRTGKLIFTPIAGLGARLFGGIASSVVLIGKHDSRFLPQGRLFCVWVTKCSTDDCFCLSNGG
jgi:hypothetical protein